MEEYLKLFINIFISFCICVGNSNEMMMLMIYLQGNNINL